MDQENKNYILVINSGDNSGDLNKPESLVSLLKDALKIQLSQQLQIDAGAVCSRRKMYPFARGFIIVLQMSRNRNNGGVNFFDYFSDNTHFCVAKMSLPSESNPSDYGTLRVLRTFVHQLVYHIPFHEMTTREVEICEQGGENNESKDLWVSMIIGFLMGFLTAYRFRVKYRGSCEEVRKNIK